jgi:hypothetical protein
VDSCETVYDDQYLIIESKPGAPVDEVRTPGAGYVTAIDRFAPRAQAVISGWRRSIQSWKSERRRAVLWGGGSKAVAFLTTIGIDDEVACAVDINPHKHGTFLPMSGHAVVGPETLRQQRPDIVIVMNPIYEGEIRKSLADLGLSPEVLSITAFS